MERKTNRFVKNIHWIIYAVFIALQAFAHAFTALFGDDYYYAAFVRRGWDYFAGENIFHYTDTNGRAFVHLVDEILLGVNINFWRVFNLAVIALIVLYAAKIAARTYKDGYDTKEFRFALIASVFLFSAISPEVYINSIYWATGAVNYLFPPALVLIYFYYAKKDLEADRAYKWMPVLAFFASFTVEQSAAASFAISVYVIFTCICIYKRRPRATYFVSLLCSTAAMISVIFAPGNAVRKTYYPEFYARGFFGKIYFGIYDFADQVFGVHGLFLMLAILSLFSVFLCFRKAKKDKKAAFAFLGIAALLSLVSYSITALMRDKTPTLYLLNVVFACAPVGIYFFYCVRGYFRGKDDDSALFLLLAALLQLVMLISPEFGYRTLLISLILLFVLAIRCITAFFGALPDKLVTAGRVAAALLLLAALSNVLVIGLGYMENYPVHKYNAEKMEKLASGETESAKLAYPINAKYKYYMAYESPYIMMRYKQLYGLSGDTVIEFENYPG